MEAIIAILAGSAIIVILVYRAKLRDEMIKLKLAEAKARDKALAEHQEAVRKAIDDLDAGIEKAKKEREIEEARRKLDSMSLKERAERLKKGLK